VGRNHAIEKERRKYLAKGAKKGFKISLKNYT
jgi:hypothetical protein